MEGLWNVLMVARVSGSETRAEENDCLASFRRVSGTEKPPVCLRDVCQIWTEVAAATVDLVMVVILVAVRVESMKRRRSKLEDTRMSIAGESVSRTPDGSALLPSDGRPIVGSVGLGVCFS